jgi:hypothetical protein
MAARTAQEGKLDTASSPRFPDHKIPGPNFSGHDFNTPRPLSFPSASKDPNGDLRNGHGLPISLETLVTLGLLSAELAAEVEFVSRCDGASTADGGETHLAVRKDHYCEVIYWPFGRAAAAKR